MIQTGGTICIDGIPYNAKRLELVTQGLRVYRQGDCVVQEIPGIRREAILDEKTNEMWISGETGKKHRISLAPMCAYFDKQNTQFFEVKQPTQLTHPDHKALTIEPGFYTMRRIRSYDPPYTEGRPQYSGD